MTSFDPGQVDIDKIEEEMMRKYQHDGEMDRDMKIRQQLLESSDDSSDDDHGELAKAKGNGDRQKMLDTLCESSGSGESGSDGGQKTSNTRKFLEEEKEYSSENFYKALGSREG